MNDVGPELLLLERSCPSLLERSCLSFAVPRFVQLGEVLAVVVSPVIGVRPPLEQLLTYAGTGQKYGRRKSVG